MTRTLFFEACHRYSSDALLISSLWQEIEQKYAAAGRHYHNLAHLDNLAKELLSLREQFSHWDSIVFSIAYHDIIYNVLKQNNEEKSADHAEEKLAQITVPPADVQKCRTIILATKSHQPSDDHEVNLFTDADLSILGAPEEVYETYFKQIRKEYSIYPGLMYWPGRKKVLQHFLNMARIFKTDYFFGKYETQARKNLESELRFIETR